MLVRMWSDKSPHSLLVGINSTGTLEYCLGYKTKRILPLNPIITLLGTYSNELKASVHTNTCTWMFTVVSFIILKIGKQPRDHSWRNKLWHIQAMEYCSRLKRNELELFEKV